MAASCINILTLSVLTSADVFPHRALTASGSVPPAGGRCLGVTEFAAHAGERVSIGVMGTVIGEAGGPFAVDAALELDSAGRFIAAVNGNKVGRAITTSTGLGSKAEILLIPDSSGSGGSTATAPGQPAKPVLTAMAGAVSLAWTPGAAGSSATTGNFWTDINGNVTQLTSNPQVIAGLIPGTPYTGTVTTRNAQGPGPASIQADAVTPTTATALPFDPSNNYSAGTAVIYAGNRYVFNSAHPAGNWVGSDATYQEYVSGVENTWGVYKQLGNQNDYMSGAIATTTVAAPTTSLAGKLQVEAPFTQVRAVWLNKEARFIRGNKFSFSSSESAAINSLSAAFDTVVGGVASSVPYNASTAPNGFRPLTWSGQAASPIQSPGSLTSPSQGHVAVPSYEFSDIVDCPSVTPATGLRPFLLWRESHLVAVGDQSSSTRTDSLIRNFKKYSDGQAHGRLAISQVIGSSGDMVADPTLAKSGSVVNPSTGGTWPSAAFFLNHNRPTRNLYAAGDSITESFNWIIDTVNTLSTPSSPFCVYNGGASGDASAQFMAALKVMLRDSRFPFTDVLLPSFSPNEPTAQSTASMASYEAMVMDVIMKCAERGLRVYVWTSYAALTPRFTGNGTAVAAIQAYNQRMRDRAAAANAPFKLCEIEQGWDQTTMSTDNTHPNVEAGQPYMLSRLLPALQRT